MKLERNTINNRHSTFEYRTIPNYVGVEIHSLQVVPMTSSICQDYINLVFSLIKEQSSNI